MGEVDLYPPDGKVSILEAYRYAADYVAGQPVIQHPLIDDNGDTDGHHFLESGYDPLNPDKDGYLAANTFIE